MNPVHRRCGQAWRSRTWLLACVLGCGEPHWQELHWPIADGNLTELPPQPVGESVAAGLGMQVQAMTWESAGVVVELELANIGDGVLMIERDLIMLAWDELEYRADPVERDAVAPDPQRLELGPGQRGVLRLHYATGRPLAEAGARLIIRKLERDGVAIVELPELALPGRPDN